ncbi:MAG: DUF998 domain-containing protein [Thermofilaceae archaeon]
MGSTSFTRILLLLGSIVFPLFHLVVLASALRNSWWSFYRHAFSDLGAPAAIDPWIYNIGLIVLGILVILFSLGLLSAARSKWSAFASGLFFVSGIFLALIGVYPGGTRPHTFVSTWFYMQSFIASTALGAALLLEDNRPYGILLCALGMLPVPLGMFIEVSVGWLSVAIMEYVGAVFIAAAAIVSCYVYWPRELK